MFFTLRENNAFLIVHEYVLSVRVHEYVLDTYSILYPIKYSVDTDTTW